VAPRLHNCTNFVGTGGSRNPPPRLFISRSVSSLTRPPSKPLTHLVAQSQYEESRKAHIRKLQSDLARANADSADTANRFALNAGGEPTKEERIGLTR
jgi:hypothetical protein